MKENYAAYWTVLASNVEDLAACLLEDDWGGIKASDQGDSVVWNVTSDRLKWGNDFLKKRLKKGDSVDASPATLRRSRRVKRLTRSSEKVALGILSGVVKSFFLLYKSYCEL
ncbi:unnamed protein product [Linum trigynum]